MRRGLLSLVLILAADFSAFPQIGAPHPGGYPPGRYPPERSPGSGIPRPRRKQSKTTPEKEAPEQLQNVTGTLQKIDENFIVLEAQDTRVLTLKRTEKTKFSGDSGEAKASEFKPGDRLLVETRQDENGYLYAVNVILQKRAAAAEPATQAPAPEAAPAATPPATATPKAPPAAADDNEGPPKLRRGWSKDRKPSPPEAATNRPPASRPVSEVRVEPDGTAIEQPAEQPKDPVLEKARAAAASFVESLPNYVCQELIARFVNTSHTVNWQPQDVVSAELVYEDGREHYRNIAINNKPTKKEMQELPGAWSTGEFGTVLADLFSVATAAEFTSRGESKAAGRAAVVYDFQVEQEHSHWRVMAPSQFVQPSYKGSIWIDKSTGGILRVEMQARRIPREFPLDKVESTVDYQYVRFGERQFLMPVHAEILSCQRGTSVCSRNKIDFRNYHKYSSESDVTFDKPK